ACGLRIRDTQSGFRAYPIELFDEIRVHRGGFVFETEVLVGAVARGWRVHEVPVAALPRERQRSRFRPISDGVAIGSYIAGRVFAPRPMPDVVSPLVRWLCSQDRLDAEPAGLAPVANPVGPPR